MKKVITFYDFYYLGQKFAIREIMEKTFARERAGEIIYYTLALEGVDEKIKICISPKDAFLVRTGSIISCPNNGDNAKGYTLWKNGICPYDIELPKEVWIFQSHKNEKSVFTDFSFLYI